MNTERHYDDEVLIRFVTDDVAATRDPHLSSCSSCGEALGALRLVTDTLHDPDVWDGRRLNDSPRQSTVDSLRAKQAAVAHEDSEAAGRIRQLLTQPRESWAASLDAHRDWWTGGLVRKLAEQSEQSVMVHPPDAIELARMAASIAKTIGESQLEALALRDYAYCLHYIGHYREALPVAERARAAAKTAHVHEQSRIEVVRALILTELGRDGEAIEIARRAAATFLELGDQMRYVSALRTQAFALVHLRRHREALSVYREALADYRLTDPANRTQIEAMAGLLQNIAICHRELREFDESMAFLTRALALLQPLGETVLGIKSRWHVARVLLMQGKHAEALVILREVREEFRELKMVQDIALVTIDMAHALSVIGVPSQVIELCHSATQYFASSGLTSSEGALTALALIREAAAAGNLTMELLEESRHRAERKPQLQFAYVAD
jgi:tetratricopeptide (TPR) repeat protein